MKNLISGIALVLMLACTPALADNLLQGAGMKPTVSSEPRATLLKIRHCKVDFGCADTLLDRIYPSLWACDSAGRDSIVHFITEDLEQGITGHTVSYSCL